MIYKLGEKNEISFDDEIHGEYAGIRYTHHEPIKPDGSLGEPLYLALDLRENNASGKKGRALPFYLPGTANALDWIKEVDNKIKSQKI